VRFKQVDGRPRWRTPYSPWEHAGNLVWALRALASASETEVIAFYRRYGPLGYHDWVKLRGEPLGWVRWQARKLDVFLQLEDGFRNDKPGLLLDLIHSKGTLLLDARPDAIEIPMVNGDMPKQPAEVMRAVRLAITHTLREALAGVRIVPADDWRAYRRKSTVQIVGTLAWEVPTLLQALYLLVFLGHQRETPIRLCVICAAPYLPRGEEYPPTCGPRCSDTLRHRRFRANEKRSHRR